MALSNYELERLANIAKNKAKLAELGLDEESSKLKDPLPPKKRRRDDHDDNNDNVDVQPARRSLRLSNTEVSYTELSDEFCLREERLLYAKERISTHPTRKRHAPSTYSDEQADAILVKDEKNASKRAKLALQRTQMHHISVSNATPHLPFMPAMPGHFIPVSVNMVHGQKKAICPRCGQLWALRKDKSIRDHSCIPVSQSLPHLPHLPAM